MRKRLMSVCCAGLLWGIMELGTAFSQTPTPQQLQDASTVVPQGVQNATTVPARPETTPRPPVERKILSVARGAMLLDQGTLSMQKTDSGAVTIRTIGPRPSASGPRFSRSPAPFDTK